jgi:IstB-like ATP binding protein
MSRRLSAQSCPQVHRRDLSKNPTACGPCGQPSLLTTIRSLPFSEWSQVIPNARLCNALLDRITARAHIVETGTESYRFRRTLENRKARNPKEP